MYLNSITAMGFLQNYDPATHQSSSGQSKCFQIENPDLPPLIHNSDFDTQDKIFHPSNLNQKQTPFNLDPFCSFNQNLFGISPNSGQSYQDYFFQIFNSLCKGLNSCKIDPSIFFDQNQIFSESCLHKIEAQQISPHLLIVAGCKKQRVEVPLTSLHFSKTSLSIFIVTLNGIGMVVIAYFFNKIETLNNEYKNIMDNLTVQMKDFGVLL